jgi:hypothetical protein
MSNTVDGEVTSKQTQVLQDTQDEQAAQVEQEPTSREAAIKAFQQSYIEKYGAPLADFLLVTRALEDVQRQVLNQVREPQENKISRVIAASMAADALARVEADLVVAVGILLGKKGDAEIAEFLDVAQAHHEDFFALLSRFDKDGQPLNAANG